MMCEKLVYRLLLVFGILIQFSSSQDVEGAVPLDLLTFDKVVRKFKTALVKFDEMFPSPRGAQEEFKKLAELAADLDDILIAEVPIARYLNRRNRKIARRFGVKETDYPKYKLFIKGQDKEIDYEGDINANELLDFAKKHSGVWITLRGCIEVLDKLAGKFMISNKEKERKEIIAEAENEIAKFKRDDKARAEIYAKTMKKVLEKGDSFIEDEIKRVKKLQDKKVKPEMKEKFKDRLNILYSFNVEVKAKDEL
ncbi:endoplasmic reticulum resident protein 29-like [Ptychodera flava]|uniref:endoplasmic reticulum resident protein 29-like n=1 Tax=Ptychodera flava TaxID=63121 RepID=UPI003969DE23